MTVQRLTWIAVLGMFATAATVYALTSPRSTATTQDDPVPTSSASNTAPTALPVVHTADTAPPRALLTSSPVEQRFSAAADELLRFSQTDALGMSPEQSISLSAFVPQGNTLAQPFRLISGRCYTLLAVGVGIDEFEIELLRSAQVAGVPPFASATSKGSRASIGGAGRCFLWNFPDSPANVVLTATKGQGVAVAQLYVK